MKNGDYITILAPMSSKLKLSGNNLLVFALIHGFSKDGEHAFYGSISYISSWLNISKNSVIDTLRVLTDSGFLIKNEEIKNGVKFCNYISQNENIVKKLNGGCEIAPVVAKKKRGGCKSQQGSCETGHNNNKDIDINIDNNKESTYVDKKETKNEEGITNEDYRKFRLWMKDNCPYCDNPRNFSASTINQEEFLKLKELYTGKEIADVILEIENRKDLRKKYSNLYRTVLNWLRNNNKNNNNGSNNKYSK